MLFSTLSMMMQVSEKRLYLKLRHIVKNCNIYLRPRIFKSWNIYLKPESFCDSQFTLSKVTSE